MALRHKVGLLGLATMAAVGIGPLAFAQNNYGLHSGTTLIAWDYQYQSPGVGNIVATYSGSDTVVIPLNGPWVKNDPEWSHLDSVAPLIAAYHGGDATSIASIFPAGVALSYSADVNAAMTVQNFNPSIVDGQPHAPSASAVTSTTESWLTQVGWGSTLVSYQASHTTTPKTSTPPSSPPPSPKPSPKPTKSKAPTTEPKKHTTKPKVSTQPSKTTQPVTSTLPTAHTTAPKSLPVTTKTQPVSVAPSVSVSTVSVPLPPKTPYLAHHHVSRSHAIVADSSHRHHQAEHRASPWPWVAGGVVALGGAAVWIVRRRTA